MPLNLRPATIRVNPEPWKIRAKGGHAETPLVTPYSAVPHELIRDRRLIPTDVLVVGAILVYARAAGSCWPSVKTLAADVGRSRRTVQLCLRRLKEAGWIGEKPAQNPTGRVLVLAWREGAQPKASPGRNPTTRPPANPIAPEWKNQEGKTFASPPGGEKSKAAERAAMTPDQMREFYTGAGWLDRPESDPLRRLAERRLMEAVRGHARPPGTTIMTPSMTPRRHHRGPRPLFG